MGRAEIGVVRRSHRLELEANRPPGPRDRGLSRSIEAIETVDAIRRDDGEQGFDAAVRADDRCHASKRDRIEAENATQQRAPGHRDRHQGCHSGKGPGERLSRLNQEHRVVRTTAGAAGRTAGRFDHRRSVGVDADDQGTRFGGRACEDRTAVTGAEIDDHSVGQGDLLVDLADVHLEEAPADDLLHLIILSGGRVIRYDPGGFDGGVIHDRLR
jgi:hypothetical protein